MGKVLDDAVVQAEDGTWTFQCPGVQGSLCGDPASGQPFVSSEWPTKKSAAARGQQHFGDHAGTPMQELHEFRRENGIELNDQGQAVSLEELKV